ncbi:SMCR8 [Bugula neritina]|uniref:SMCR8 n=1 Tax=Bugula neritina TaxID=10212 RepID=A0A7J7K3X9_BUGNE|nr:SMCR8 [Bugula neritina]
MIYGLEEAIAHDVLTQANMADLTDVMPMYLRHPQTDAFNKFKSNVIHPDFLMLTEFTDDIGPVPLTDYTIPSREEIEKDGFNLDQFAIKIMSADYFAQANTHDQQFKMVEDMHALISDSYYDCYTLLYAFTLYDIQGRGYVRPVYLSYTSKHRGKLVALYESLVQSIAQAVGQLMKSNIRLFAKELDVYIRKYHDLYSTSSMSVEDSERLAYIEEVFLCVTKKLNFDFSEFDTMKVREEDNFRLITQLSDGWPEFKESLLDIYKGYSPSLSQISQSIREEITSTDVSHHLRIGDVSLASLICFEESKRKPNKDFLPTFRHRNSTASVASIASISSCHSSNSTQTTASSLTNEAGSVGSDSSDQGIHIPTSVRGRSNSLSSRTSLTHRYRTEASSSSTIQELPRSLQDELNTSRRYNDSQSTIKAELVSNSTDSLSSRLDGEDAGKCMINFDHHAVVLETIPGLGTLISEHKQHVRDLLFCVLAGQPLILLATDRTKAELIAETLSSFLPNSRPKSLRIGYWCGDSPVSFKSIFRYPITCAVTSARSAHLPDSLKVCSSVYNINIKHYIGPAYQGPRAKEKGLLDLFYRKKKHRQPYFSGLVKSLMMEIACKAKLLYSILQTESKINDEEIKRKLGLSNSSDVNIVKNLVFVVVKQQHASIQAVKMEELDSVCVTLTSP